MRRGGESRRQRRQGLSRPGVMRIEMTRLGWSLALIGCKPSTSVERKDRCAAPNGAAPRCRGYGLDKNGIHMASRVGQGEHG